MGHNLPREPSISTRFGGGGHLRDGNISNCKCRGGKGDDDGGGACQRFGEDVNQSTTNSYAKQGVYLNSEERMKQVSD